MKNLLQYASNFQCRTCKSKRIDVIQVCTIGCLHLAKPWASVVELQLFAVPSFYYYLYMLVVPIQKLHQVTWRLIFALHTSHLAQVCRSIFQLDLLEVVFLQHEDQCLSKPSIQKVILIPYHIYSHTLQVKECVYYP